MINNKFSIIDLQHTDITNFIMTNIVTGSENSEFVIIHSGNSNIDREKLFKLTDEIIYMSIAEMEEEDCEDCVNAIVILEEIEMKSHYLRSIIANAETSYYIKTFEEYKLTKKEAIKLLSLSEIEGFEEPNIALREIIQVVENNKYHNGINSKQYVEAVENGKGDYINIKIDTADCITKKDDKISCDDTLTELEDDIIIEEKISDKVEEIIMDEEEKSTEKEEGSEEAGWIKSYFYYLFKQVKIIFNKYGSADQSAGKRILACLKFILTITLTILACLVMLSIFIILLSFALLAMIVSMFRSSK